MTVSPEDICNAAINRVSGEPILSIGDTNKEGRACNIHYPLARDFCLSLYSWSFARKTKKLQALDDEHPYGNLYGMPSDCITPIALLPTIRGKRNWHVEGRAIIDADRLSGTQYLVYTQAVTNSAFFTKPFIDLVILEVAVRICPVISEDSKLLASLQREAYTARRENPGLDATIGDTYPRPNSIPENDAFVYPPNVPY